MGTRCHRRCALYSFIKPSLLKAWTMAGAVPGLEEAAVSKEGKEASL